MPSSNSTKPNTVLRGLTVLKALSKLGYAASTAKLLAETQLPKATLHRILLLLAEQGFIRKDDYTKEYLLGVQSELLAYSILDNDVFRVSRRSILESLSTAVNETCNCTIQEGNHILYFDRVESNWPLGIKLPVGTQLPLHCTASGKVFLSHFPKKQLQAFLASATLEPKTQHSITDPEALMQALKVIKKQGYALDSEEFLDGLVSIAVPVFDAHKKVRFTIAIHAPKSRRSIKELTSFRSKLQVAADSMQALYMAEL